MNIGFLKEKKERQNSKYQIIRLFNIDLILFLYTYNYYKIETNKIVMTEYELLYHLIKGCHHQYISYD